MILVGGIRSLSVAERIIDQGLADYLSMSRPFIREPGLIKRWMSGDLSKATCLSDNQCFGPAMAGEGIYCVVEKKEKEKVHKKDGGMKRAGGIRIWIVEGGWDGYNKYNSIQLFRLLNRLR